MKNKFLALAAFVTAVLGGAILSAPASAQIAKGAGPTNTIDVTVNVPEILYLRTAKTATVNILASELVTNSGAALSPVPGSTPPAYQGTEQLNGTGGVDTTTPFALTGTSLAVKVPKAYIVWSNSPTGSYDIAITPAATFTDATNTNSTTITLDSTDSSSTGTKIAEGLTHSNANDIILNVPVTATTKAGSYEGNVTVEVWRQ